MKIIDVNTWNRKSQYENFIKYSQPTFSLSTRLDVTNLVEYTKNTKKSFFSCFLFFVTKAVNEVEEMRTRLLDGKPVLYDAIHPSYIVIREDEVIVTCQTEFTSNFNDFYENSRKNIAEKKATKGAPPFESHLGNDVFYLSCIPWMDVVSVINPYNFNDDSQTSIPRITWGKFVKNALGRYEMGFDISVHHALIDGFQVSKVVNKIALMLDNAEKYLGD